MDTLLIFFLNRSFLDLVKKKQKPVFLNRKSLPFLFIILNGAQNFKIYRLCIRDSDWLNLYTFQDTSTIDQVSLDIKKKRGSSINLDIHHTKVLSSGFSIMFSKHNITSYLSAWTGCPAQLICILLYVLLGVVSNPSTKT